MLIKVLICDEIPLIRDGLQTLLDAEPDMDVVGTTDSGIHAMILVRKHRPHVVLTGLNLRSFSGLELVRRLQQENVDPAPHVVIFAMNDSEEVVNEMLEAGADGLLIKTATRDELRSAIMAAASGQVMLSPAIAKRLLEWYRLRERVPAERLNPLLEALTAREREVLMMVAQGMSTDEVAKELSIAVTTVRTHVLRLRCKLEVRDRAQLVSFAFRAGLMRPA